MCTPVTLVTEHVAILYLIYWRGYFTVDIHIGIDNGMVLVLERPNGLWVGVTHLVIVIDRYWYWY